VAIIKLISGGSGGGGGGNAFTTIQPSSGTSCAADGATDTLTLTGDANITVTGTAATDTITFAVPGIATHAALTATHGVAGAIVGTTDTQTLTNKTIVAANNTVTTAASGNLAATELNAALAELQTDIDTRATSTALSDHLNDASDAHDASAISNTAINGLDATDVQAAIAEMRDYRKNIFYFDDFVGTQASGSGAFNWTHSANSGLIASETGTTIQDSTHPGVVRLSTSTSASSAPTLGGVSNYTCGVGLLYFEALVYLGNLSDGTETYRFTLGLTNTVSSAAPSDGVYITYTHGTNSGKFLFNCTNNSATTTADMGTAVAATTWYRLGIVVNAAGTSAQAYINGVAAGSAITANIPTGTRRCGPTIQMVKTAGTTARLAYCDYAMFRQIFTATRG